MGGHSKMLPIFTSAGKLEMERGGQGSKYGRTKSGAKTWREFYVKACT